MTAATLGRKQLMNQSAWFSAIRSIEQTVPRRALDVLLDETVGEITAMTEGKRAAFAWSGGKDSLVLEQVCYQAGITECVMVICDLEYPVFLQWVTDHMPYGLELVHTGQDLEWLAKNQHMLFPQDGQTAAKWFKQVQHTGQAQYFKREKLDMLLLGRRKADGNYTGKDGSNIYTNSEGVTRYSPLRDWSHEDVLAYLHYYQVPLPPIYGWPNGYRVGTGPWPARQWTTSIQQGWREVYSIDSRIVRDAARVIPSARDFLRRVR
jgi:3'-phosphoadenosine 5'-phosphosulfate sulfotransferase (PAPS reductase)/FAD synthetase